MNVDIKFMHTDANPAKIANKMYVSVKNPAKT